MDSDSFVVQLTKDQYAAVAELFATRQWDMQIQPLERYLDMKNTAEDYCDPGTKKPLVEEDNNENERRLSLHSDPASLSIKSSIKSDKFKRSFNSMKNIGSSYNVLRSSSKEDSDSTALLAEPMEMRNGTKNTDNHWRMSTMMPGDDQPEVTSNLSLKHYCVADDKLVKVITQISTEHVQTVSQVPVRIILLVDRSGSMLHKLGKDGKHSKITKVKHFAKQLVSGLDDGDEISLVTFGDTAEIFFPLEKLNDKSRTRILQNLHNLDKGSMSRETNLSAGLRMALKVFFNATKRLIEACGTSDKIPASLFSEEDYISTKNSILIFSDGEINAGTKDSNSLLHEVRQNIRQMVPRLDDSQNQWVTISVVTTGSSVSEQAYMLSKTCSSEAYYYIDKDAEDPEAELFLPVLLRKTAVAWNVSCVVESFFEMTFVDDKCSSDNRVRMRRSVSGRTKTSEKAYFLYDFPAGHSRQIGVCADWSATNRFAGLTDDEKVMSVRVEFTNINGDRYWQEQIIRKSDVIKASESKFDAEADTAVYKHELRLMSNDVLRSAADVVKSGDKQKCQGIMRDGQKSLQALLNEYGAKAEEQVNETSHKTELTNYVQGVVENMGALIDAIEKSSSGVAWNRIKAVSTAITRESPNVSDSVVDGDILCPLPDISHMETGALKEPIAKLQEKKNARKRATFGNLDALLHGQNNQTYGVYP